MLFHQLAIGEILRTIKTEVLIFEVLKRYSRGHVEYDGYVSAIPSPLLFPLIEVLMVHF